MGHDLRIIWILAMASLRTQMQYRTSFALQFVGNFIGTAASFLAMWALFHRFGSVGGWSFAEGALLYSVVSTSFALGSLAAEGFEDVPLAIRSGAMDRHFLRPCRLGTQIIGSSFYPRRLGRLAQALLVLLWALAQPPSLPLASFALLGGAILGGALLFAALFMVNGAIAFWTVESVEVGNCLTYGGEEAAQYPMSVYGAFFRRFFTVLVPLACVSYYPVVAALGRVDPLGSPRILQAVAPIAGILFLVAACWFWRIGVRRYRSTGS